MRTYSLMVEGRAMTVVNSVKGRASPGKEAPYTAYAHLRQDARRELAAFRRMAKTIEASSVIELFGGSGWHAASIQELVKPDTHVALDWSDDCVASMKASLPEISVFKADSFKYAREKLSGKAFEWVHADFNQFTLMRHMFDKYYSGVLDGIFACSTRTITITDSAVYGLTRFERNLEPYKRVFGKAPRDWKDYYQLASKLYFKQYGWSIRRAISWGTSSIYNLTREPVSAVSVVEQKKLAQVEVIDAKAGEKE